MKRKLVAIASADWHIHKFKDFDEDNSRLKWSIIAAEDILQRARGNKVPLLFSGDILHDPKEVENETLSSLCAALIKYKDVRIWAISGNHDMSEKNSLNHRSPTYLDSLSLLHPNLINIDNSRIRDDGMVIDGIPYMNSDKELIKAIKSLEPIEDRDKLKILMLHGNPAKCKSTTGFEIESEFPEDMDKLFKAYDLVLWGHVHQPQELGKKSVMLGSPIHQNFGDMGVEMGYWEIYSDGKRKFIPMNDHFPCFVRGTEVEISQGDAMGFIKMGMDYIEWLGEEQEEQIIQKKTFDISKSRDKLAKLYCKKQGIKEKAKIKALIDILNQAGE